MLFSWSNLYIYIYICIFAAYEHHKLSPIEFDYSREKADISMTDMSETKSNTLWMKDKHWKMKKMYF